jgi:SAM-dependent methyltransferase
MWTERTVAWYERANAASDYAPRVLAAIEPLVTECRTALDVGAGFGALAMPLAHRMARVTALEPSPPMAAALRRAALREGVGNLVVIEAAWGAAAVEPHDLVLCAHVGPLLRPGSSFLTEVSRVARRGVVLIHDAPGGDDKFFLGELYPLLRSRPYQRACASGQLLPTLRGLGLALEVVTIEYRSDQPLESLDEAGDFWTTYLGRDDAETRAFLQNFLATRLRREGDGWIAPYRKRATVIWWRP